MAWTERGGLLLGGLLLGLALLSSCGYRGKLYLPEEKKEKTVETDASSEEKTVKEERW
jgi:predicted small lipoprotein YifL